MIKIEWIDPARPLWPEYVAHLRDAGQARHVIDADGHATDGVLFLAAVTDGHVCGSISLLPQVVTVPATDWSGGVATPLTDADGAPLREAFVETFFVAEEHRRRGCGRLLQEAALELAREHGCVQLRSWSSLDKPANYRLKLSMGFAMHPATDVVSGGLEVCGVYFVKRVDE